MLLLAETLPGTAPVLRTLAGCVQADPVGFEAALARVDPNIFGEQIAQVIELNTELIGLALAGDPQLKDRLDDWPAVEAEMLNLLQHIVDTSKNGG
jgi:hypothetical protein